MDKTISLSAIILAGGQSSRMGQDKALIAFQGVPLLQQVCEVALKCTAKVYVVTPWQERYQDIIPSACLVIREVTNLSETQRHGPLVGFAQGLAQIETDWVLLLACDLPHLQVEVLQLWAKELENVPQEAIAFLSKQTKGWEPLCGFYRKECLPKLTEYINAGGRSFQGWLSQHTVQELPVSDTKIFFNCNTPADLQVLRETKD
ncbi:MAG: molybdenum cofactor guanylyltransferase [Coleofasciculaceae cyanobacterium]